MGEGLRPHSKVRGYLLRTVLFYESTHYAEASSITISGAYDAVYPSNSLKVTCYVRICRCRC